MKSKTPMLVALIAGGWILLLMLSGARKLFRSGSRRTASSIARPVYRVAGYLKVLTVLFLVITNAFVFLPAVLYKPKDQKDNR